MKSCHAIDRPLNDRRGNSRQLVDCLWLPPISGVRHPDFRKIPKINSPYYYSSNNRERLVGQVSSRGRGWLRSRIHRSEIIPYFGIRARVQRGTNKVFFLRRVPYIGLPLLSPPFRRGIRVRNGKRGNVRTFFLPSALFPLRRHTARITSTSPAPTRFVCIILSRCTYPSLTRSRILFPSCCIPEISFDEASKREENEAERIIGE